MARPIKQVSEVASMVSHGIHVWAPGLDQSYTSQQLDELTDQDRIVEVRRFATQRFVDLGKISADAVGDDGLLVHDNLMPMSTFFASYRKDKLQATARLLWREGSTVDQLRLPLEQINTSRAEALLDDRQTGKIAEIGSMAKVAGAPTVANLELLHSMWRFAVEKDIGSFVCGLDPNIYPSFRAMFGDALEPLTDGPIDRPRTVEFPGIHGPQVPLRIDVNLATTRQEMTDGDNIMTKPLRLLIGHIITRGLDLQKTTNNSLQNL